MNVKAVADQVVKAESGLRPSSHAAGTFYSYSRLNDFLALTKPRVIMLSVFTALLIDHGAGS
jgi:heme O synthase-like polyprenyltransferase